MFGELSVLRFQFRHSRAEGLVCDLVGDRRRSQLGNGYRFDRIDAAFAYSLIDRIINLDVFDN